MKLPVLIAGAGPTGLTLGCVLARAGVRFRIVDKAPQYFPGSRGKGLQPRSLEVFDDLGIVEETLASGRFHLPFRAYKGAEVLGERDMHEGRYPTPDVPYASPLIIPQWRVEEILRGLLAKYGIQVELATELIDFNSEEAVTLAHTGKTEKLEVSYLAGCDGGHSFVRRHLGVGFEGETWPKERMLVGDVKIEGLGRDHWHSWQSDQGWLALCPLPSTTDSFQLQAQIGPEEPDEPSLERFQQIADERAGAMGLKLREATWLSLYRVNIRMVNRYRVGSVFLAGDAAHVHSPAGGQGMNTGIQDAYNLGWKLAEVLAEAPPELLDTYEEERLPVAAEMLGITTRLHRSMDLKRGPETLQLGIHYRESSLSKDDLPSPGNLRAGDRAPDAPCRDSAGKSIRLFDLFRGPHFTLLNFSAPPAEKPYPNAVHTPEFIDSDGHVARVYDVEPGTLVLVRPDGYIGLMTAARASVDDYLKRVLPA